MRNYKTDFRNFIQQAFGLKQEKSTGLALVIAKKIIEGHCGKIGVNCEVGKGSTFYFSFPYSKKSINIF